MSFPPKGLKVINKSNELMLFFNYLHRNGAEGEEKKRKTWRDGTTTHEVLTDKAGRVRCKTTFFTCFKKDIVKTNTHKKGNNPHECHLQIFPY